MESTEDAAVLRLAAGMIEEPQPCFVLETTNYPGLVRVSQCIRVVLECGGGHVPGRGQVGDDRVKCGIGQYDAPVGVGHVNVVSARFPWEQRQVTRHAELLGQEPPEERP